MKKTLLFLTILIGSAIASDAENRAYTYFEPTEYEASYPVVSSLRRVSPNGQWAVGGDEIYETGSVIIDTTQPEVITKVPGGLILDVDNNGLCVGSWYNVVGESKYPQAAIYVDGQWKLLPLPDGTIGRSYAVAISDDSHLIAGSVFCHAKDSDIGGKFYPCVWALNNATGNYQIERAYNTLDLPANQGFWVNDMSGDGRVICGYLYTGFGNVVAAMIKDGDLKVWHTFDAREVTLEYDGQPYTKIGYFVDGALEQSADDIVGTFNYATDNYLYGYRTQVTDVSNDGMDCRYVSSATIYDIDNDTFIDGSANYMYVCGCNTDQLFTSDGKFINHGARLGIGMAFGVSLPSPMQIGGILSYSQSGRVMTGEALFFNDAVMAYDSSPMLIILDENILDGIQNPVIDYPIKHHIAICGNQLTVYGASTVAIYTSGGALVTNAHSATLPPGLYIVNADGHSSKIAIK